jgi:esterase/lipase
MKIVKSLVTALLLLSAVNSVYGASYKEVAEVIQERLHKYDKLVKEGSRPFFIGQGKKTRTVLLLHGLSDSPTSMKEVAEVYAKNGYNVIAPRLSDHGLKEETRSAARSNITLESWRTQVEFYFRLAMMLTETNLVSVAGYSMGGALTLDLASRYEENIADLVFIAPMFQMYLHEYSFAIRPLKELGVVTPKGVDETSFFYSTIDTNQTYHASLLSDHLREVIIPNASERLKSIPKLVFLTKHDTTIDNSYVYDHAFEALNLADNTVIEYQVFEDETEVLHRDLPVKYVNETGEENKFLPLLKLRLEQFVK